MINKAERLVILQPLFLPWMGMFDMMGQADLFVILDNVQFSRQSWQQRNRIKTSQGVRWLSVPVVHRFGQKINEVKIDYGRDWVPDHLKTIYHNYKKAPHFDEIYNLVEGIYRRKTERLCDLSFDFIQSVKDYLKIPTRLMKASEVPLQNRGSKDYVLDLCRYFKSRVYLNGPAGKKLYDPKEFKDAGIDLIFHEYVHPVYPQLHGEFVPYLSVVDLLFNCGSLSYNSLRPKNRD